MSSYVVADRTINSIVAWVSHELEWNRYTPIKHLAPAYGVTVSGEGWEEALGVAMMQLNCDAVNDRYASHPNKAEAGGYTYQVAYYEESRVQAFKTMMCWLYQCREGAIPQAPLYQFLNEVAHELAVEIVRDSKDYDKAEWV